MVRVVDGEGRMSDLWRSLRSMLSPHNCLDHINWGLLLGKGVCGLAGASNEGGYSLLAGGVGLVAEA